VVKVCEVMFMVRGPKKTVSVLLPLALYDQLKLHAEADRHSLSGEIRQILKGYVEYMERGGVSWCRGNGARGKMDDQS